MTMSLTRVMNFARNRQEFLFGICIGLFLATVWQRMTGSLTTREVQETLASHAHAGVALVQMSRDVVDAVLHDCRDHNQVTVFGSAIVRDVFKVSLAKGRGSLMGNIDAMKELYGDDSDVRSSIEQLSRDAKSIFEDVLKDAMRETKSIQSAHLSIVKLHTTAFRKQYQDLYNKLIRELGMLELVGQGKGVTRGNWHDHAEWQEAHWKLHGSEVKTAPNVAHKRDSKYVVTNTFAAMESVLKDTSLSPIDDSDILAKLIEGTKDISKLRGVTLTENHQVRSLLQVLGLDEKHLEPKSAQEVVELHTFLDSKKDHVIDLQKQWQQGKMSDKETLQELVNLARDHQIPRSWMM